MHKCIELLPCDWLISNLCYQAIEQVYLIKWPVSVGSPIKLSPIRLQYITVIFLWCQHSRMKHCISYKICVDKDWLRQIYMKMCRYSSVIHIERCLARLPPSAPLIFLAMHRICFGCLESCDNCRFDTGHVHDMWCKRGFISTVRCTKSFMILCMEIIAA